MFYKKVLLLLFKFHISEMAFSAFWLHKSSPPSLPLKRTYLVYINTKLGGEDNIIAEGKTHICAIHIGGPFALPSFHCFIVKKYLKDKYNLCIPM